MRLSPATGLAVLLLAAPAFAQTPTTPAAPAAQHETQKPAMLHLNVHAEVKQAPDIATFSVGAMSQASSAKQALSDNATRMKAVFDGLVKAGLQPKDMQTGRVSLQPEYAYEPKKAPKLTGYKASNSITIKLRDLDKAGGLLDTLTELGANEISGPAFAIEHPEKALDEARRNAMKTAAARAKLYAEAAGLKVVRLRAVREAAAQGYRPIVMGRAAAPAMMKAETPIAPGEVSADVTLDVTYELAP